jgi:diguanylate cyclase (GGDEF)-like protein
MRRIDKYAWLYVIALLPLAAVAIVWALGSLPNDRVDTVLIVVSLILVSAAAQFRIQLPKTDIHLSLADAIVMFSLIYFGGELAVLLSVASATATALVAERYSRSTIVGWLANTCVAAITIFVTAVGILSVFGTPDAILDGLDKLSFIWLTVTLLFVPFALNTMLTSAYLAISGESRYWQSLKTRASDAFLVYSGAATMAGLAVIALRETNIFLFFAVVGIFGMLHVAFRRYKADVSTSREQVEFEKSKLSEKHVSELKHYIGELEKSSLALRHSREKYRYAAYHDLLTGLPNRNKLITVIDRSLKSMKDKRFTIIYLDLQRFKTVNDSLGHATGDQLIGHVAARLINLVGENDVVARINGDEFAILLSHVGETSEAEAFARKVVEEMSEAFTIDGRQIFTGVSMGIVIGDGNCSSAVDLLRDADIAMYRAKELNRDYVFFEERMHVQAISLLELETDLRLAVERNEFELFYQPIVDLDNMQFCGVEALVRWNHPRLGRVGPDKFIEVAEATGLIVPMTLQILESACLQLNAWQRLGSDTPSLFVSVNLSGRHFMHPDVVEHIGVTLIKSNVDPRRVKLEITETAVMDNAERAATVLRQIKDLGVQLSIDDFGTGYSSLSYLQRFPIDALKIDRAFVGTMEDGRQNGEIVSAILALAASMNLSVIAEGIESVHQLHQLRILGCRFGQGYLFSQPMPADKIAGLIEDPTRWQNLVSGTSFSVIPPATSEIFEDRVQVH